MSSVSGMQGRGDLNCVLIVKNRKIHAIGVEETEVEISIFVNVVNSLPAVSVKLVTSLTQAWLSFHCLICAVIVARGGLRSEACKRKST